MTPKIKIQSEFMESLVMSLSALTISILSLIISIFQKKRERDWTIRKNLSGTLENVTKINIEVAKLKQDNILYASEDGVGLRRVYNSQRRILIAHADFLVTRYDLLATESDCNVLAGAFDNIGDYEKSEIYWVKTIEKSRSNSIKHMNLRGYARFLFFQGKFQLGRSKFEEALKLYMPDTDANRRQVSDTYFMWATVEREFNNYPEVERLIRLGQSYCDRIGHLKMREEMKKRFEQFQLNIKNFMPPSDV
jgi:tetratricopeptide (TPR) repeat protein